MRDAAMIAADGTTRWRENDLREAGPELIREWIERAARHDPDKPYIVSVEDGRTLSYGALYDLTRRMATLLGERGIATNDRIALLAGNAIEHVVCYLGVMAYGATICTVHAEMNRRHLGGILAQLNPRLAIVGDDIASDASAATARGIPLGRWDDPQVGTLFAEINRCGPSDVHLDSTTALDDGVILFTSGTTDRPKGVVLSYREQIGNIEPVAEGFGITASDRVYDFRSFNWASAQLLGVLAPLSCGARW